MSSIGGSANPVSWMNRMVSEPYYLLHCLVFFSYIPVRCSAAQLLSSHSSAHLLHREIQALLAFFVLVAIKVVRTESWEAFVADTLFYAKKRKTRPSAIHGYNESKATYDIGNAFRIVCFLTFLAAIALVLDYHLALWYAVAFLVMYIIAQQPAYGDFGASSPLTPLQLEALLTETNTSKYWMVEFRSLSTSSCIPASSFIPELSITFSNKNLSFATIDLGLFPNAAEKFGISLGSLHQLPTYVLFHDGAPISRLPEMDYDAKLFDPPVTKKLLCRHFELDKLFLDYINGK